MRIGWQVAGSPYMGSGWVIGADGETITEADIVDTLANPNGILRLRVANSSGTGTHTTYLVVRNVALITIK